MTWMSHNREVYNLKLMWGFPSSLLRQQAEIGWHQAGTG